MNMNRSGHSEMRDPEWYRLNADRARLSPSNMDAESSLQNSLTSLNLDSFTGTTELQDHYSVRSLPVFSSNASIAAAADAPWNESPRSLRGRPRAPPNPAMSPLDQLQNSISSLTSMNRAPPLTSIITEDLELEEDLNASLESLNILGGPNTEMDATAHAGNVSRAQSSRPLYANPISPVRSMRSHPTQSSSPYRYGGDASYAGSSITSRASTLHRNRTYVTTDEPSLSTLGDGDDYGDEEDDDNLEIIKLLRKQVETLKSQLISEQEKNQELKLQQRQNMRPHSSYISASSRSFAYDNSSDNDSFGCDDHHSVSNSICSRNSHKLSEAESGIAKSIAALKDSLKRRQENAAESTDDEEFLMDELVICELENHFKVMGNQHKAKLHDVMQKNKELKKQNEKFENHILELEKNKN